MKATVWHLEPHDVVQDVKLWLSYYTSWC